MMFMNRCIICGGKAGLFSKKTSEGHICKECASFVPVSVRLNSATDDFLKELIDGNKGKKELFETTASYESAYIDSIHGLFCISEKGTKEKPAEFHDIYRLSELTEIGLFCSNPRNVGTNSNKVVCDIKMRVKTEKIFNDFILAAGKKCTSKSVGNGKLEWNEPADFTMFRNMFNQMIDNEMFGLLKKLQQIAELKSVVEREQQNTDWAKGILFIGENEDYTPDLLKAKRNELVKIFHPDRNSDFADTEKAAQINKAFRILNDGI